MWHYIWEAFPCSAHALAYNLCNSLSSCNLNCSIPAESTSGGTTIGWLKKQLIRLNGFGITVLSQERMVQYDEALHTIGRITEPVLALRSMAPGWATSAGPCDPSATMAQCVPCPAAFINSLRACTPLRFRDPRADLSPSRCNSLAMYSPSRLELTIAIAEYPRNLYTTMIRE